MNFCPKKGLTHFVLSDIIITVPTKGQGGEMMDKYLFLKKMESAGYNTQKELALHLNISEKVLSNHLNGITKLSTEDVAKYCKELNITDSNDVVSIFLPKVS